MNINSVVITGNLTRDVELKETQGGLSIATLGVAVNGSEKKGDVWEDRPDFFNVTVFGKSGENCAKYLQKGSAVAVSGRLRQDRWEDDQDNNKSVVKIVAQTVQFLNSNTDGGQAEAAQRATNPNDIPF